MMILTSLCQFNCHCRTMAVSTGINTACDPNQELFRSLRYAYLPHMCVLILRASSVRKTCAPVRTRAVCFGLQASRLED